jgi:peptidoglycan/xylan/chitin deacetylase (PgdA/CDA1 family)
MYHRIAPEGRLQTARWRLAPRAFEDQLRYLRESGFHTPHLHDWAEALRSRRALPERAVLLTFDDGYLDFYQYARPLLRRYGLRALVFVVSDCVGKTNLWDGAYGEVLPLMDWAQLREIQREGSAIGSHSATHAPLTALSPEAVVRQAASSRAALAHELGGPIDAFAYPYGDCDAAVQHAVGACGYTFGLTAQSRAAAPRDALLALPRIEVHGGWSFAEFVAALHG